MEPKTIEEQILAYLVEEEKATPLVIAKAIGANSKYVWQVLKRFEEAGFVENLGGGLYRILEPRPKEAY